MASKLKVNTLSLKDKIEVIKLKEQHHSIKDLCIKFKCGKTQIYDAIKRKKELIKEFESGSVNRKRKSAVRNEDIDAITFEWFSNARAKNLPIPGTLLREKAKEIAEKLGNTDFKASSGWLMSFINRHNIAMKQICGESKDIPENKVQEWKETIPLLIEGYQAKDIYNCDETGLFYRALPTKSLAKKGSECHGGKNSKERITVLLCANMEGNLEKPFVIGKSKKPRCFKNVNIDKLPVTWKSQKKSWMSSVLMEWWLTEFNNRMIKENRKILLFLDNAPCHADIKLSNIMLQFLPANTTAVTQPMDQGIIKMMKTHYKKYLLRSIIASLDDCSSATELTKNISVLDAVKWIAKSCSDISSQQIARCFRKAGFVTLSSENDNESFKQLEENDVLQSLIDDLKYVPSHEKINSEDYISVDNAVCTTEANTSVDVLIELYHDVETDGNENEDDCDSQKVQDCGGIQTYQDALINIKYLENFFLSQKNEKMIPIITELQCATEECMINIKKKQTSIKDYFPTM